MADSDKDEEGFKYWAFISYSSKDKDVAIRLHRKLEGYVIPKDLQGRPGRDGVVPAKIFPVFRDRDELPLSSDLGGTIQGALKASRYLIVLCSPNSAKSQWVNEEIRCFKSLGREDRILAVILDGEPGAADMPGREDEECFPEAIKFEMGPDGEFTDKRCEPIGGDLRKGGDGWERVFLKAMAGITGLGFDAFARRQLRRKRRKQLVLGALCLLAPLAGLWTWDYNRLKVDWYAHAEEQFGVPVGIRELSAEEISHRGRNLRFESRRGKLRRVLEVDGFGNQYPSQRFGMVEASMLEVVYGDEGQVVEHRLYRRDGGEVLRRTYSDDLSVVEFKAPGGNAARAASGAVGSLTQRDWGSLEGEGDQGKLTEITRWELTRDEEGFVKTRRFQNIWGAPRANAEGVFGVRFLRDEQGLVVREQTMGEDGQVAAGRGRLVAEVRQEYGEFVKPIRTTYHDASGTIVRSPGGHVEERSEFDQWGNETGKVFLGPDGEWIRRPGGFARVEAEYGDRGEILWQAYFGAKAEPILVQGEGHHLWRSEYDEEGNEVRRSFFGVKGELVLTSKGNASYTLEHDAQGHITRHRYFGLKGEPVLFGDDGNHRGDRRYDEHGNAVEISYWGAKDEPVELSNGWHRMVIEHDQFHRPVVYRHFGKDGKPTLGADGIHRHHIGYDDRGNIAKQRYFGVDGEKVMGREGYHEYRAEHDGRGHETGWSYHGVEGEPVVPNGEVIHRVEVLFGEDGMEKERNYWGTNGAGSVDATGVHRRTYRYNSRGQQTEARSFGVSGDRVIDIEEAAHRVVTTYNDSGVLLGVSTWGVGEEAVLTPGGYHRRAYTHDERGNRQSESYFDENGEPCLRKGWGVHRLEMEFDEFGQELTQRRFGVAGEPVLSTMGYHMIRNQYDVGGRILGFAYFGVEEEPINATDGFHRIAKKFDARGNTVEWSYFDKDGDPAIYGTQGYHRLVYERNVKGRERWARYFGIDGKPVIYRGNGEGSGGFHARERVLDGEGRVVNVVFYGEEEEPIINVRQGCHRFSRTYNSRGQVLEERYFGLEDRPLGRSGGLHLLKQTFDARGNELSESYFGVDGTAILWGEAPCHQDMSGYDRNGWKIETKYVGIDGEPVLDQDGRHMIKWKHDEFGESSEIAFYGAGGTPTISSTTGFHRMTRKNSPMGQVLEEAYWDTAGKRTVDQLGKSKTVWKFDGAGRLTFHAFYGVEDEPFEVDGVARKEGDYDPVTGELLEVRKFDAAGKEL